MPPAMLIDALQGIRRRVRVLSVGFGAGVLVTAVVVALLLLVLVDYLLNLPAGARIVAMAGALAVVAAVAWEWVCRPAVAKLTLSDVAGRLEQAFPQFDDRLRSTVDFARGQATLGSATMQQRVMDEAAGLASRLDLGRAIVMRPVWWSLAAALGAIVLAIALALVVNPDYTRIALARLLRPFDGPAWPRRVQIELLGNVPQRVPVGDRVELRMKLARGDRASTRARVFYQVNDGPVAQEFMTRNPDGTYTASLDARGDAANAASTMKVWMTAGDDRRDLSPIAVLPRLAITEVQAVLTPPKYVGKGEAVTVNLGEGAAMMAAGAEVALRVSFNKALASDAGFVRLIPISDPKKAPKLAWERSGDRVAAAKFTAVDSLRFRVQAIDVDGFRNTGLEEYELIVRPDQNPTVQIENPRRNEERTPQAVVPLVGVAEDDYGINSLKLVVDRLGDKKHWEIDLVKDAKPGEGVSWSRIEGSSDRQRFRVSYSWELPQLDPAGLRPGDVLEYGLVVTDNYSLGGQAHAPVASGKLRITIVSQEQFAEAVSAELRTVASQVSDLLNGQNRTKQETADLAKETRGKEAFTPADRAVAERLGNQQQTTASQSRQVASRLESLQNRMEENKSTATDLRQLAGDVKESLNRAAEDPMKAAAGEIASANKPDAPAKERDLKLESAVNNEQRAADQLQGALDKLGAIGSLSQTIERIRDLLNRQQAVSKETAAVGNANLGKKPDEMTPEDRNRLEKAAKDQEELAGKTDKAVAELNKLSEQLSKSDPSAAAAMKQAAETAQQQQVAPNQSRAAQQARQNQQSSAQSAQKQAEIGLQLMLNDLREAEKRKLEELNRKLAELQEQIKNLIRRQAGHNLDNLAMQGPERLAKVDQKQRDELNEKAGRGKEGTPPPELAQLTNSQEQTERNTRDIAKDAEQNPNGAEPSANLTRAASRMERAIVSLRDKQLAGAYEPPQVEALAALEEAARVVQEQKNKVEQKRQEQKKESLRQAYEKIRDDQKKVNGDTARIDKAPKLADGNLKREDAIRLGQLPGEQGKLGDRVKELDEDLAALGGIVYVWANKDIATSMDSVKGDLAKKLTGAPTQAEQARVIEQLEAMIESLKSTPKESKFADRNNGGGGGSGGGAKLPPEAELRLLKALQLAVNKSTRTLAGLAQKDKPKLEALGGRQGELRQLLANLLEQATQGQIKLGEEPPNKDQLPEEAKKEDVENQELDQELLGKKPEDDKTKKDLELVGDRMARSRQRLALNHDPGKVTQIIQEKIVFDLDKLINEARSQQSSGQQASGKPGERATDVRPTGVQVQPGDAQAKAGQAQPNKGSTPAGDSAAPPPTPTQTDLSQEIRETQAEWGRISPRLRSAVIEGASEQVIGKYRKFVEEYYKGLSQNRD